MSNTIDSCSYQKDNSEKCPKSKDGKHNYKVVSGSWPSCLMECKYCKDKFYTK